MQKYKSRDGRNKIIYSYTGEFDAWVPATMEFLGTMMPPTLSRRAAAMLLLVADMLKDKFDIDASVNLAARLMKRWKSARKKSAE